MATSILSRSVAVALGIAVASGFGGGTAEARPVPPRARWTGSRPVPMSPRRSRKASDVLHDRPGAGDDGSDERLQKAFPKIKATFLRLQAGNLFQRLMSERQAKTNVADVMSISEMTFATDLQKRGGYMLYDSPETAPTGRNIKSQPEGYFGWGALIVAGLAYNPKLVPASEAPKNWHGCAEPDLQGRGEHQTVHLRPAARGLVQAAPALRRGLLDEVRRAAAARRSTATCSSSTAW